MKVFDDSRPHRQRPHGAASSFREATSGIATRCAASSTRLSAPSSGWPSRLGYESKTATHRGEGPLAAGVVKLLLDGQQRMTSLYGVVRGKPPKFFDGNSGPLLGFVSTWRERISSSTSR